VDLGKFVIYTFYSIISSPPFFGSFFAGAAFPFYATAYLAISSFYFFVILGSLRIAISSASNASPLSFLI